MRAFFGFLGGLVFGLGLIIAQMTNPAKVLAFLDILDGWDPSLAFVMGGGVLVFALGFWAWRGRESGLLGQPLTFPRGGRIDRELILGAILFGLGWGLIGLCPGPAIAALFVGGLPVYTFVAAMIGGMVLHRFTLGR